MNPIKENQKIKIIPDKIENFSMGVIISEGKDCFVAEVNDISLITVGSKPEILISSEDYIVMFTSKISKIELNKVFFSVTSKFTFIQKREYPRISTKIPVLIKEANGNQEIESVIINIGGGGMQVTSSSEFNLNSILDARFNLTNKKEINTLFEILRIGGCEQNSISASKVSMQAADDEKFFLSGKFKKISNFDKTAIVQFCFKRQLESKCKK